MYLVIDLFSIYNIDEWIFFSSLFILSLSSSNRYHTISTKKNGISNRKRKIFENASSPFMAFVKRRKQRIVLNQLCLCVVQPMSRKQQQLSLLLSIYWRPREQLTLKSVIVQQQPTFQEWASTKEQHRTPIGFFVLFCHLEKFPLSIQLEMFKDASASNTHTKWNSILKKVYFEKPNPFATLWNAAFI